MNPLESSKDTNPHQPLHDFEIIKDIAGITREIEDIGQTEEFVELEAYGEDSVRAIRIRETAGTNIISWIDYVMDVPSDRNSPTKDMDSMVHICIIIDEYGNLQQYRQPFSYHECELMYFLSNEQGINIRMTDIYKQFSLTKRAINDCEIGFSRRLAFTGIDAVEVEDLLDDLIWLYKISR